MMTSISVKYYSLNDRFILRLFVFLNFLFNYVYLFLLIEQKIKTMSPTELLQSRSIYDNDKNDSELMQTTLSQYQTPSYLAE